MSDPLVQLAVGWSLYFVLHSLFATNPAKSMVSRHAPWIANRYRLVYNIASTLALIPILILLHRDGGAVLWAWDGISAWIANGIAAAAAAGFLWTTRYYDMNAFLGFRPETGSAGFTLSPMHRIVRHPWYFFLLLIIWTRDFNEAWLVSASAMTAYLIIGSRLEDRKLIGQFGKAYGDYVRCVPGLIPIPGKFLRDSEATNKTPNGD